MKSTSQIASFKQLDTNVYTLMATVYAFYNNIITIAVTVTVNSAVLESRNVGPVLDHKMQLDYECREV